MKKAVSTHSRSSYFLPFAAGCLLFAATALCAPHGFAQVMEPAGTMPGQMPQAQNHHLQPGGFSQVPAAAPPKETQPPDSKPAAPPAPQQTAPSLSDRPPEPAKIQFKDGKLSIQANNSGLKQILEQIASTTGMNIDGLGKDSRVFGIYGPGNPREVLSDLLTDSGYNFMMVGSTTDGAPKQLTLTDQSSAPVTSATNRPQPADDEDDASPQPVFVQNPPDPSAPVPGAPSYQPPSPSQGAVKTPQQILQELQQIRQTQTQQSNPQ
jgi:hypothetical protein